MRKALFHNWPLKLFAAGLAVIIWFTVHHATTTEANTIFNVRVEPQVPEGWRLVRVEPDHVEVVVRGERADVTAVGADHFSARPVLSEPRGGRVSVEMKPDHVEAPEHIQVIGVSPDKVFVTIEPSKTRGD